MARQRIEVQVFPAFRREFTVPWLRRVAERALAAGAFTTPGENTPNKASYRSLSLVIADDPTVLRLNRDYRGLDEPTDVLAFASDHAGEYEGEGTPPLPGSTEPFVTAPEEEGFAGEVIVSYPQCLRQAAEHGHSAAQEMALLITHGVLHLLGYDHATPEEEQVMSGKTQEVLAALEAVGKRLVHPRLKAGADAAPFRGRCREGEADSDQPQAVGEAGKSP